jgi:nucleolin
MCRDVLLQAGTVTRAVIMRQRRGGNNRSSMGCGVVEFATEDDSLNAVETLSESELKGRKIHCREDRDPATEIDSELSDNGKVTAAVSPAASAAVTPGAASKVANARTVRPSGTVKSAASSASDAAEKVADPCKVFVSGLDWNVDDDELKTHFSSVGPVVNAEVMHNKKGRSMGSGIVEFADIAAVQAAVTTLSDSQIRARKIGVRQYYQ